MAVTANRDRESLNYLKFYTKTKFVESSMIVHVYNPNNQKAKVG